MSVQQKSELKRKDRSSTTWIERDEEETSRDAKGFFTPKAGTRWMSFESTDRDEALCSCHSSQLATQPFSCDHGDEDFQLPVFGLSFPVNEDVLGLPEQYRHPWLRIITTCSSRCLFRPTQYAACSERARSRTSWSPNQPCGQVRSEGG